MAFDYYFVSVTGSYSEDLLIKLGANCLLSYYVDSRLIEKFIAHKRNGTWSGKLMIDNGAFTVWKQGGEVNREEYLNFLNKNLDYIDYAISLDKIPGRHGQQVTASDIVNAANETYNNFLYMREHIKDTKKLLPVFHQREPFKYLEQFLDFDDIDYICIAAHDMNIRYDWYEKVFATIQSSKHPNINVHGLGNSIPDVVRHFPFTSIDATSWKLVGATGSVITSYGQVYVGTRSSIDALPSSVLDEIKYVCSMCDIDDVYLLASQYSARAKYIMYELFNQSRNVSTVNRKFKKIRRLF